MQISRQISAILVAATLLVVAPVAAFAEPASAVQPAFAPTTEPTAPVPATDVERYAAREAKDESAAKFQGGDGYVYIGGGTVGIILIIVLLVVLL